MKKIYLDHAATSPMNEQVIQKMISHMESTFGNPSSIHSFGREARKELDESRMTIAKAIGAKHGEIVFTSGGTEADNMAILGAAYSKEKHGKHIITTAIEHHAVLHTCEKLETEGFEVTYLQPDENGLITVEQVKQAIRTDTILVTIMFGNNEVGTIQPIEEIGQVLKETDILFHTDAVQAFGLLPIDVDALHVDLLSISSHKINGPKGIGCLYIRQHSMIQPISFGGEQELKRRPGTENVPAIIGFAKAVHISQEKLEEKVQIYKEYKEIFIKDLKAAEIEFEINGEKADCLAHIVNISFTGTDVESMLVNLDMEGIAVSSGSACTAGSLEPSHVLVAMFSKTSDRIRNSIRFSFGQGNTKEQIEEVVAILAKIIKRLKG